MSILISMKNRCLAAGGPNFRATLPFPTLFSIRRPENTRSLGVSKASTNRRLSPWLRALASQYCDDPAATEISRLFRLRGFVG